MSEYREEHDLIGYKKVPNDCYYGVQTLRAVENFHISLSKLENFPVFINAFAKVKKACALANNRLGLLDDEKKEAIIFACDEILAGKYYDQFPLDMYQGGAGTSTNMNVNEVICNIGLEKMGHAKGEYQYLHPNNHVNLSQSTNDTYPSAIHIALYDNIFGLCDAVDVLLHSFEKKEKEFEGIVKMGRTQLQDAVPMTVSQEFKAFKTTMIKSKKTLKETQLKLRDANLGATAIGTGINSHPDYTKEIRKALQEVTGESYEISEDLIEATQDTSIYVLVSTTIKNIAIRLSKICNDLRLLSSGPTAGLGEINLPAMQPGSSIMPGKVNPVIPEVVNQIAFDVIGSDLTVTLASEAGQLQLNVMEPVIVFKLLNSISIMEKAYVTLSKLCIDGITVNREVCENYVKHSISIVTVLNPIIGYQASTDISKEALATGKSVHDLVLEKGLLSKEELEDILRPENMTQPVFRTKKK